MIHKMVENLQTAPSFLVYIQIHRLTFPSLLAEASRCVIGLVRMLLGDNFVASFFFFFSVFFQLYTQAKGDIKRISFAQSVLLLCCRSPALDGVVPLGGQKKPKWKNRKEKICNFVSKVKSEQTLLSNPDLSSGFHVAVFLAVAIAV